MKKYGFGKLLLFTFITFFIIFSICEVTARVFFHFKYKGCNTSVAVQGSPLQKADSLLTFMNRPYYTDYDLKYQFNELGMKGQPGNAKMPVKKPGDYWVFLFGASAMEGMGSNKTGAWLDITGVDDYPWNESLAFLLQQNLQAAMPDKRVTVFCAANSMYSIHQSIKKFESLSNQFAMDYVISLDGNNEPAFLADTANAQQYITNEWQSLPIHRFPTTAIVPITSRSAFANGIKQWMYHLRHQQRLKSNVAKGFPERAKWLMQSPKQLNINIKSENVLRAASVFTKAITRFDSLLIAKGIPHTLFVQPHLSLRANFATDPTEKAVYNYYSENYNDEFVNGFQQVIHEGRYSGGDIYVLNEMHHLQQPVFVDYCHFTPYANKYFAGLMAKKILESHNKTTH